MGGAHVIYDDGCKNWHFDGEEFTIWRLSAAAAPLDESDDDDAPPPPSMPSPDESEKEEEDDDDDNGGGGGDEPTCPICLEVLDGLGVVTLPCNHKVCIGCMGELIASNPTFESQQPHNRGKVLPAPWLSACPLKCGSFSQREMRRTLLTARLGN